MGQIKTALELAMERTQDVTNDKESLKAHEIEQEGKRMASRFLNDPDNPDTDLGAQISKFSGKEKAWILEGIFQVIKGNLQLPQEGDSADKLKTLGRALNAVIPNKKQTAFLIQQLEKFFAQYQEDQKRLQEGLEAQYGPRLKKKEQEISKQIGTKVKLNPTADPEFMALLRQNKAQLDAQYGQVLAKAKQDLETMFAEQMK